MIPDEVLNALGLVTANSAALDWSRAMTHYLLDPDQARPVDHRLGLSRDRMTRELISLADRLAEPSCTKVKAWATTSEDVLKDRDERIHAYWEPDPESPAAIRRRHRSGTSGPPEADELKMLANRIGICGIDILTIPLVLAD